MPTEADRIARIADPFALLKAATERLAEAQREVTELSRLRQRVITELHGQGLSYAEIAAAAGLTRGRIHQLKQAAPAPESAFLGTSRVIIATPLKQEASNARPVLAAEDFAGANRLAELARSYRLEPTFEHIPLSGAIDLNRDGLVVVCGPRLSQDVAGVLATDPRFRFEKAADGPWTLRDLTTDEVHRAGMDSTPATDTDVAYLARLPRPDGNGLLLVLTGIHPQGSLGVIHLITHDLEDLYQRVGTGRFSVLVDVTYDPESNEPISVRARTPFYNHDEE
ncbi:sigma factor-like helix-turn-helix DNA-binding protein [Yinghuangia soli]|uniref:Sigma-70 family RNA polymerase sigma factor n=1 Tax=Yinghuangia soli TaxID=2908204 RepID=A0AA41U1Z7_9ACTN|nr:sigma factor-like helix-turn-helix DNA-binding protein [Yinghuangia soli]MCF2526604.1 sigma-70 family RNA polymerase sigma factor [Yinghuangia soli]